MRKQNSEFKTSFLSEAGRQLVNRDYHGYVELDDFACWVVATGIDECENKKSAEIAVKGVLAAFVQKPGYSKHRIKEYLKTAHRVLKRESNTVRLKASVMIIVTDYMTFRYTHAGNVKLQVLSNNHITFESKDHSYYAQKIADGTFHIDRSKGFEERNNLINYAGMHKGFKIKVSKKRKLRDMDSLLLTTVGFWEQVMPVEVIDGFQEANEPVEVTDNLEDQLLSKHSEILNNYTILAIFANKLFLKEKKVWSVVKKVLLIMIPLLIILGIFLFMRYRQNQTQLELTNRVLAYQEQGVDYINHGSFARGLTQFTNATALLPEIRHFENEEKLRLKHRVTQLIVDGYTSVEREDFTRAREYFVRARNYLIDEGETIPMFTSGHIIDQIDYIDTKLYIEELLHLGDLQVGLNQYSAALETYRTASRIVIGLNNLTLMQRLNISIDTAQSLYNDAARSLARAQAEEAVREAQEQEGLAPEELALLFEDVARIYQDAGLYDEATRTRLRADDIRKDALIADSLEQQRIGNELESQGDAALIAGDYEKALAYYQAAERIYRGINSEVNITLIAQKILAVNDLIGARERRLEEETRLPIRMPEIEEE